ncbi:MAG: hypothetical protein ABH885_00285, partial [Candidatus Omnitrophota bacterium]
LDLNVPQPMIQLAKLLDDNYKEQNYYDVRDLDRTTYDIEEEKLYRSYAADIGAGGKLLGELYNRIEKDVINRLYEAAMQRVRQQVDRATLEGTVDLDTGASDQIEGNYRRTIDQIRDYRDAERKYIEELLLGNVDITDEMLFDMGKGTAYVYDTADKEFAESIRALIKRACPYFTDEEARQFLKGIGLSEMLHEYDRLFEEAVAGYDAVIFRYEVVRNVSDVKTALDKVWSGHIGTGTGTTARGVAKAFADFGTEETKSWNAYSTGNNGAIKKFTDYEKDLENFISEVRGLDAKRSDFFEKYTWVPVPSSSNPAVIKQYQDFLKAHTVPGVTQVSYNNNQNAAYILGYWVVQTATEMIKQVGERYWNFYKHINQNRFNPNLADLFTDLYWQDQLDEAYYYYSNALMQLLQSLFAGTFTYGLNNEGSGAWWRPMGAEESLKNYTYYSKDYPELMYAEVGRRIIEAMVGASFEQNETPTELEAEKLICALTGEDFGNYQYKTDPSEPSERIEYFDPTSSSYKKSDDIYKYAVIGDGRYASYDEPTGVDVNGNGIAGEKGVSIDGLFNQKKAELVDKFILHGAAASAVLAGATLNKVNTGVAGAVISSYNDTYTGVDSAISSYKNSLLDGNKLQSIVDMGSNLKTLLAAGYYAGGEGIAKLPFDQFNLYDLYLGTKGSGTTGFLNAMAGLNADKQMKLVKILYGDIFDPNIIRSTNITTSVTYVKDRTFGGTKTDGLFAEGSSDSGSMAPLWDDMLGVATTEMDFFDTVMKMNMDYFENGSEDSTWFDVLTGAAVEGRRNVHDYGVYRFKEFYGFDTSNFTNDLLYDYAEEAGNESLKALGVYAPASGKTQNRAFEDWVRFNKGLAYDVSTLEDGVIAQIQRDESGKVLRTKNYGDEALSYDMNRILEDANPYVYSVGFNTIYSASASSAGGSGTSSGASSSGALNKSATVMQQTDKVSGTLGLTRKTADNTVRTQRAAQDKSYTVMDISWKDDTGLTHMVSFADYYDYDAKGVKGKLLGEVSYTGSEIMTVPGGLTKENYEDVYRSVAEAVNFKRLQSGLKALAFDALSLVGLINGIWSGIGFGTGQFYLSPLLNFGFGLGRSNILGRGRLALGLLGKQVPVIIQVTLKGASFAIDAGGIHDVQPDWLDVANEKDAEQWAKWAQDVLGASDTYSKRMRQRGDGSYIIIDGVYVGKIKPAHWSNPKLDKSDKEENASALKESQAVPMAGFYAEFDLDKLGLGLFGSLDDTFFKNAAAKGDYIKMKMSKQLLSDAFISHLLDMKVHVSIASMTLYFSENVSVTGRYEDGMFMPGETSAFIRADGTFRSERVRSLYNNYKSFRGLYAKNMSLTMFDGTVVSGTLIVTNDKFSNDVAEDKKQGIMVQMLTDFDFDGQKSAMAFMARNSIQIMNCRIAGQRVANFGFDNLTLAQLYINSVKGNKLYDNLAYLLTKGGAATTAEEAQEKMGTHEGREELKGILAGIFAKNYNLKFKAFAAVDMNYEIETVNAAAMKPVYKLMTAAAIVLGIVSAVASFFIGGPGLAAAVIGGMMKSALIWGAVGAGCYTASIVVSNYKGPSLSSIWDGMKSVFRRYHFMGDLRAKAKRDAFLKGGYVDFIFGFGIGRALSEIAGGLVHDGMFKGFSFKEFGNAFVSGALQGAAFAGLLNFIGMFGKFKMGAEIFKRLSKITKFMQNNAMLTGFITHGLVGAGIAVVNGLVHKAMGREYGWSDAARDAMAGFIIGGIGGAILGGSAMGIQSSMIAFGITGAATGFVTGFMRAMALGLSLGDTLSMMFMDTVAGALMGIGAGKLISILGDPVAIQAYKVAGKKTFTFMGEQFTTKAMIAVRTAPRWAVLALTPVNNVFANAFVARLLFGAGLNVINGVIDARITGRSYGFKDLMLDAIVGGATAMLMGKLGLTSAAWSTMGLGLIAGTVGGFVKGLMGNMDGQGILWSALRGGIIGGILGIGAFAASASFTGGSYIYASRLKMLMQGGKTIFSALKNMHWAIKYPLIIGGFAGGNFAIEQAKKFYKDGIYGANGINWLNRADTVASLARGATWGLVAAYVFSRVGFSHGQILWDNVQFMTSSSSTFVKMQLKGALSWMYISPMFTAFNALWTSFFHEAGMLFKKGKEAGDASQDKSVGGRLMAGLGGALSYLGNNWMVFGRMASVAAMTYVLGRFLSPKASTMLLSGVSFGTAMLLSGVSFGTALAMEMAYQGVLTAAIVAAVSGAGRLIKAMPGAFIALADKAANIGRFFSRVFSKARVESPYTLTGDAAMWDFEGMKALLFSAATGAKTGLWMGPVMGLLGGHSMATPGKAKLGIGLEPGYMANSFIQFSQRGIVGKALMPTMFVGKGIFKGALAMLMKLGPVIGFLLKPVVFAANLLIVRPAKFFAGLVKKAFTKWTAKWSANWAHVQVPAAAGNTASSAVGSWLARTALHFDSTLRVAGFVTFVHKFLSLMTTGNLLFGQRITTGFSDGIETQVLGWAALFMMPRFTVKEEAQKTIEKIDKMNKEMVNIRKKGDKATKAEADRLIALTKVCEQLLAGKGISITLDDGTRLIYKPGKGFMRQLSHHMMLGLGAEIVGRVMQNNFEPEEGSNEIKDYKGNKGDPLVLVNGHWMRLAVLRKHYSLRAQNMFDHVANFVGGIRLARAFGKLMEQDPLMKHSKDKGIQDGLKNMPLSRLQRALIKVLDWYEAASAASVGQAVMRYFWKKAVESEASKLQKDKDVRSLAEGLVSTDLQVRQAAAKKYAAAIKSGNQERMVKARVALEIAKEIRSSRNALIKAAEAHSMAESEYRDTQKTGDKKRIEAARQNRNAAFRAMMKAAEMRRQTTVSEIMESKSAMQGLLKAAYASIFKRTSTIAGIQAARTFGALENRGWSNKRIYWHAEARAKAASTTAKMYQWRTVQMLALAKVGDPNLAASPQQLGFGRMMMEFLVASSRYSGYMGAIRAWRAGAGALPKHIAIMLEMGKGKEMGNMMGLIGAHEIMRAQGQKGKFLFVTTTEDLVSQLVGKNALIKGIRDLGLTEQVPIFRSDTAADNNGLTNIFTGKSASGRGHGIYILDAKAMQSHALSGSALTRGLSGGVIDEVQVFLTSTPLIYSLPDALSKLSPVRRAFMISVIEKVYKPVYESVAREVVGEKGTRIVQGKGQADLVSGDANRNSHIDGGNGSWTISRTTTEGVRARENITRALKNILDLDALGPQGLETIIRTVTTAIMLQEGQNYQATWTADGAFFGYSLKSDAGELMKGTVFGDTMLATFISLKHGASSAKAAEILFSQKFREISPDQALERFGGAHRFSVGTGTLKPVLQSLGLTGHIIVAMDAEPLLRAQYRFARSRGDLINCLVTQAMGALNRTWDKVLLTGGRSDCVEVLDAIVGRYKNSQYDVVQYVTRSGGAVREISLQLKSTSKVVTIKFALRDAGKGFGAAIDAWADANRDNAFDAKTKNGVTVAKEIFIVENMREGSNLFKIKVVGKIMGNYRVDINIIGANRSDTQKQTVGRASENTIEIYDPKTGKIIKRQTRASGSATIWEDVSNLRSRLTTGQRAKLAEILAKDGEAAAGRYLETVQDAMERSAGAQSAVQIATHRATDAKRAEAQIGQMMRGSIISGDIFTGMTARTLAAAPKTEDEAQRLLDSSGLRVGEADQIMAAVRDAVGGAEAYCREIGGRMFLSERAQAAFSALVDTQQQISDAGTRQRAGTYFSMNLGAGTMMDASNLLFGTTSMKGLMADGFLTVNTYETRGGFSSLMTIFDAAASVNTLSAGSFALPDAAAVTAIQQAEDTTQAITDYVSENLGFGFMAGMLGRGRARFEGLVAGFGAGKMTLGAFTEGLQNVGLTCSLDSSDNASAMATFMRTVVGGTSATVDRMTRALMTAQMLDEAANMKMDALDKVAGARDQVFEVLKQTGSDTVKHRQATQGVDKAKDAFLARAEAWLDYGARHGLAAGVLRLKMTTSDGVDCELAVTVSEFYGSQVNGSAVRDLLIAEGGLKGKAAKLAVNIGANVQNLPVCKAVNELAGARPTIRDVARSISKSNRVEQFVVAQLLAPGITRAEWGRVVTATNEIRRDIAPRVSKEEKAGINDMSIDDMLAIDRFATAMETGRPGGMTVDRVRQMAVESGLANSAGEVQADARLVIAMELGAQRMSVSAEQIDYLCGGPVEAGQDTFGSWEYGTRRGGLTDVDRMVARPSADAANVIASGSRGTDGVFSVVTGGRPFTGEQRQPVMLNIAETVAAFAGALRLRSRVEEIDRNFGTRLAPTLRWSEALDIQDQDMIESTLLRFVSDRAAMLSERQAEVLQEVSSMQQKSQKAGELTRSTGVLLADKIFGTAAGRDTPLVSAEAVSMGKVYAEMMRGFAILINPLSQNIEADVSAGLAGVAKTYEASAKTYVDAALKIDDRQSEQFRSARERAVGLFTTARDIAMAQHIDTVARLESRLASLDTQIMASNRELKDGNVKADQIPDIKAMIARQTASRQTVSDQLAQVRTVLGAGSRSYNSRIAIFGLAGVIGQDSTPDAIERSAREIGIMTRGDDGKVTEDFVRAMALAGLNIGARDLTTAAGIKAARDTMTGIFRVVDSARALDTALGTNMAGTMGISDAQAIAESLLVLGPRSEALIDYVEKQAGGLSADQKARVEDIVRLARANAGKSDGDIVTALRTDGVQHVVAAVRDDVGQGREVQAEKTVDGLMQRMQAVAMLANPFDNETQLWVQEAVHKVAGDVIETGQIETAEAGRSAGRGESVAAGTALRTAAGMLSVATLLMGRVEGSLDQFDQLRKALPALAERIKNLSDSIPGMKARLKQDDMNLRGAFANLELERAASMPTVSGVVGKNDIQAGSVVIPAGVEQRQGTAALGDRGQLEIRLAGAESAPMIIERDALERELGSGLERGDRVSYHVYADGRVMVQLDLPTVVTRTFRARGIGIGEAEARTISEHVARGGTVEGIASGIHGGADMSIVMSAIRG